MKMTFGHTDVPSVSLRYLLVQIRSWMQAVKEKEHLSKYVTNPDAIEALKLSSFVRSFSRQLFHVPTLPIPLIPLYSGNPSDVFQRVFHTLREERLRRLDSAIGTAQEVYTIVLALKSTLLQNGLQDCSFEVENVGKVKIVSVLQRLIDHVIIRKTGFPFNEQVTSFSSLSGLSVLTKATKLLNELTVAPDAKGDKGTVYLREMNGASLMLEIAEYLESNKDISLSTPTTTSSACLDVEELMGEYSQLAGARQIQLACEPRPFNYRLVDGGPDQRQSHLPTKIAAAIEFRMELSAHACIQRRAERDSVANEAERGNSILGRAATIGSSVSNSTFKTTEECLKKLEGDLQERSVDTDEITKVTGIATSLGDEFVAEMNMWYGAKELASRWNGFPCFGRTIFAQTPLSFYQLPLSHLLEADIHAYIKAGKKDKDSLERFDWIRQNLKWYNAHATISPSGYYDERRACCDPNCCGTRMLPLIPPSNTNTITNQHQSLRGTKGCGKATR